MGCMRPWCHRGAVIEWRRTPVQVGSERVANGRSFGWATPTTPTTRAVRATKRVTPSAGGHHRAHARGVCLPLSSRAAHRAAANGSAACAGKPPGCGGQRRAVRGRYPPWERGARPGERLSRPACGARWRRSVRRTHWGYMRQMHHQLDTPARHRRCVASPKSARPMGQTPSRTSQMVTSQMVNHDDRLCLPPMELRKWQEPHDPHWRRRFSHPQLTQRSCGP